MVNLFYTILPISSLINDFNIGKNLVINNLRGQHPIKCGVLFVFVMLYSLMISSVVNGKDYYNFESIKLTAPFNISQEPISGNFLPNYGNELILIGEHNNQPQLALYAFIDEQIQYQIVGKIHLPRSLFSFDVSSAKKGELQKVLFLSSDAVWELNTNNPLSLTKLSSVNSIYLQHDASYFQPYNFIEDINNDGLMDIKLASFNSINLYLNDGSGQFIKQVIPVMPDVELFKDRVTYTEPKIYFADMNADDKTDIVHLGDKALQVFIQQPNGLFELIPKAIPVNANISSFRWWKERGADGKNIDQSDIKHRTLRHIVDINNDGLPDMLVQFAQSSGVLEKVNDYEIYLGKRAELITDTQHQLLQYDIKPNSELKADGTLMDLDFIDLNEQQKNVILTSTFDISLSQIISALLAGSVDQNILLFTFNDKGFFKERVNKEVQLTFSLSSGKRGSPVVLMTDINGDGNKELILSADENKLDIYPGLKSAKLIVREPQSVKLPLPKDGRLISAHDINDDGRHELLIRYNSEDKKHQQSELLIFKLN